MDAREVDKMNYSEMELIVEGERVIPKFFHSMTSCFNNQIDALQVFSKLKNFESIHFFVFDKPLTN